MSSKGDEALASARKVLELAPYHLDAKLFTASLLMDLGRYAEADSVYGELANSSASLAGRSIAFIGRVGRAEALIGQGKVKEAAVQVDSPLARGPSARRCPRGTGTPPLGTRQAQGRRGRAAGPSNRGIVHP